MKGKCGHKAACFLLRTEWQKFWSHFSLAERDNAPLGSFGAVNSLELCNITLAYQEVGSDKANTKWQEGETSLFMAIHEKFMK